jgi:hypothetical protein
MVAQISAGKADRVSHSSIPFASEMLISGCRWGRRCADVAVKKKKKKKEASAEKTKKVILRWRELDASFRNQKKSRATLKKKKKKECAT